jgi:hypothetical protein
MGLKDAVISYSLEFKADVRLEPRCSGCEKNQPVARNNHLGWYHYEVEACGCEIASNQRYTGKCTIRNAEK